MCYSSVDTSLIEQMKRNIMLRSRRPTRRFETAIVLQIFEANPSRGALGVDLAVQIWTYVRHARGCRESILNAARPGVCSQVVEPVIEAETVQGGRA